MQGRGVLMIGLIYVHLCVRVGEAASDATAIDFVAAIGKEVQAIAAKVEENDAKRCDLAKTCQCSRVECLPRKNANNLPGSQCVYTDNNTACPSKNGSPCTSIRANFLEGYVRIPPLDFKFGNSIEGVVGSTVCAHSSDLDSTFRTVFDNLEQGLQQIGQSNLRTLYTIYFGAVDGSNRYFPGLETINRAMCGKYEPRVRPWYTGAISVVKDLVILIDTGFGMLQTFSDLANVNSSSLLEVAKSMTASVMRTLTANDRATIVPFNESVSPRSKTWLVPGKGYSNSGPPELQDFVQSVGPGSAQPDPTLASNFTAGFLKASSIFNDPDSPDQSLKIVILITDGNGPHPPSLQDLQTALNFEKRVRLFVYEIPKGDLNYPSPWASVCCTIGGYNEKLDKFAVVVNPMSSLTSYFSFLARSHIAAQGTMKPFWQVGYVATNGLGNLTSATYLAMSADRLQLIGVVGINIQIAGFIDKDLIARVQSYLFANDFTTIPLYPNGADIPNCNASTKKPACGNQSTPTHVLCNLPDEVDLKATPASILCCEGCGDILRSTWEKHKVLILSTSLGIPGTVLLLMLSTCTVKYGWGFCSPHSSGLPMRANPPPPIVAYSFEDMCKATNDFEAGKIIGRDTFGVQYKARLGEENLVVIMRLSRQSADRTNDLFNFSLESADHTSDADLGLQADMLTLEIDDRPCQLTLKGTSFGPANQQELNGNIFGPSDRFSVYAVSEYDSWL